MHFCANVFITGICVLENYGMCRNWESTQNHLSYFGFVRARVLAEDFCPQ